MLQHDDKPFFFKKLLSKLNIKMHWHVYRYVISSHVHSQHMLESRDHITERQLAIYN